MSEGDTADGHDRYNVRAGHQLRGSKRSSPTPFGSGARVEWTCLGCERSFESRSGLKECDDPTLWVRLGTPGDGLGYCVDCGAVFAFEYQMPFHEHDCPNCGSSMWERRDDVDAEPEEVLPLDE